MIGSKPKLVIFEGPDKAGKSTLFQKYRRATNYIPLAIDRFTGSNYVYDIHYNRPTLLDTYLQKEREIQEIFDCYLVLLLPSLEVLEKRIKGGETGEAKKIALANYREIAVLFSEYFLYKTKYSQKLWVDTGESTVNECLKLLLEFTKEGSQ
jgi:thymidylate kinase